MKSKYPIIIIGILFLTITSLFQYSKLSKNYAKENAVNLPQYEDFEEKIKDENEIAVQNEKEYQQLLLAEQNINGSKQTQEQTSDQEKIQMSTEKQQLHLHALSALLLDARNNRVLYQEHGYEEMPMASTTKIMTCIVALENGTPDAVVKVSANAARMPDVQLNIKAGEEYYLKDLLYSLMLESHNDTAVAIAEHIGGTVEGFAIMMNDKAKALGCNHTNFITPNGLDAEEHYTTARDLAVIASYAIKNKQFLEITNSSSHSFKEIRKGKQYTVNNKNRFLSMMNGAIGVKTGFTGEAGYCFVGAIEQPDRTLISVVLGCGWPPNKNLKWADTRKLMNYGMENYTEKQIFQKKKLDPLPVKRGRSNYAALTLEGNLSLLMRDEEKVTVVYELPDYLQAPVTTKDVVGKAKYYIDDLLYAEVPIYSLADIQQINLSFCFLKLLKLWYCQ